MGMEIRGSLGEGVVWKCVLEAAVGSGEVAFYL